MHEQLENHIKEDFNQHKQLKEASQKQKESIDKLLLAIYGDGNGNPGMYAQVKEMHTIFTRANWMKKMIIGFFSAIGIIAGGIIAIIELFRHFRK